MDFYCSRNWDGLIHVQNVVEHMFGQHHVHDDEDFERWKNLRPIEEKRLIWIPGTTDCSCGLKSGEMR